MKNSKIIKILTLTSSLTLVTLFITYRGGYFDNLLYSENSNMQISPNGGAISESKKDTSQIKKDSIRKAKLKMSSSKSLIIIDDMKLKPDSITTKTETLNTKIMESIRMSSSKSGIIFRPKLLDSTFIKKQTKKKNKK